MNNLSKGFHLFALLALATLTGCNDDNPWSGSSTEGGIRMNFTVDAEVECLTRAADNQSPMAPGENDFKVGLKSSDGTYSKEWKSLEDFNNEPGFPIGDYTVSVFHGDLDTEGFRAPYYTGNTPVHVSPGAVSDANVTAALANAMVSVRYTDEFKSMFRSYSSSLLTTGHKVPVILEGSETRPAYVSPTEVTLGLTLTNDEGKSVTVNPIVFPALARHHHIVTLGVNSDSSKGTAILDVTFDDALADEEVPIPLGDELFSTPAPEIQPKGFVPEETLQSFEYATFAGVAQLDVVAFGGMKSVLLEISDETGYAPVFSNSVELVNAGAVTQAQLASAGLECSGFFKAGGKMGVIDLAGFISKLKHGEYTITLKVVDEMSRAAEPVSFKVRISEVGVQVLSTQQPSFFGKSMYVDVSTDCPEIKGAMTFMVDKSPAVVKSVSPLQDQSGYTYNNVFRYELEVPEIRTASVSVQATLGTRMFPMDVPVERPVLNISTDAFAQKVWLKIQGDTEAHTKYLCDHVSFYNGDAMVPNNRINYIPDNELISISGLAAGQSYNAYKIKLDTYEWPVPAFTTETEAQLPNSSFAELGNQYKFDKIQCGGKWNIPGSPSYRYTNFANINRYQPQGWITNNDETCYSGSSTMNTWFVVPSTFVENGAVTIRTVGYHHNGTEPAQSANGGTYYCTNAPSELNKSVGLLALGSETEGSPFTTRPSKLTFYYKYAQHGYEKGVVIVKAFDANKSLIFEKKEYLDVSNVDNKFVLNLPSYTFGVKCSAIYVAFMSSNSKDPGIDTPSGDKLNEGVEYRLGQRENWVGNDQNLQNTYKAFAKGSELIISNLKLEYGD